MEAPKFDSNIILTIQCFNSSMPPVWGAYISAEWQVNNLAKLMHDASKKIQEHLHQTYLSSSELVTRITTLEQLTHEKVFLKRQWHHYFFTLSFIKLHDHVKAKKILNDRQTLIEQYLAKFLSSENTDPAKCEHILHILDHANNKTKREILKDALRKNDQVIIKRCRELLPDDTFKQKEWEHAIKKRDLVKITSLISEGVNVNTMIQGNTALMLIIKSKYIPRQVRQQLTQQLLAAGADPNIKDRNGETALMHAVRGGHPSIVQNLIAKGADLSATTYNSFTALHVAVLCGQREISMQLIDAMATPSFAFDPPPSYDEAVAEPDASATFEHLKTAMLDGKQGIAAQIIQALAEERRRNTPPPAYEEAQKPAPLHAPEFVVVPPPPYTPNFDT